MNGQDFKERRKRYRCKDCYMFDSDCDCEIDGENEICGDFMTTKEYETGTIERG